MARVICRVYGSGTFHGVTFQETLVDGRYVGVGHTSDPDTLARLQRTPGFTVEGDPPAPEGVSQTDDGLDDLTVPELRDLAEERGVDLDGATRKADIVAALRDA